MYPKWIAYEITDSDGHRVSADGAFDISTGSYPRAAGQFHALYGSGLDITPRPVTSRSLNLSVLASGMGGTTFTIDQLFDKTPVFTREPFINYVVLQPIFINWGGVLVTKVVNDTPYVLEVSGHDVDRQDATIGTVKPGVSLVFPTCDIITISGGAPKSVLVAPEVLNKDSGRTFGPAMVSGSEFSLTIGSVGMVKDQAGKIVVSMPNRAVRGIVYGDMKISRGEPLFGKSGSLLWPDVFSAFNEGSTLYFWWDFSQGSYGNPHAFVNGVDVCASHSTGHIVDYPLSNVSMLEHYDAATRTFRYDVEMRIEPSSGHYGGPCGFCLMDGPSWDASTARARLDGDQTTTARFRASYDIVARAWSVQRKN